MDILRAEKIAKDRMLKSHNGEWDRRFILILGDRVVACKWLDPYFGFFEIDGQDGFLSTSDIPANAEVLMATEAETPRRGVGEGS